MPPLETEWETARAKVSRSSFYLAMRLMPEERREAMFAIYAFNRAVDDIADEGDLTAEERVERLNSWRDAIDAIYAASDGPVKLAEVVTGFHLRREDFVAVIDGVEMDATGASFAPDLATLDLYCDRVASAVGRLCIKIFGMDEQPGFKLAHHLGRALQFTNILRDLSEDAALGRLYLPREILAEAGIHGCNPPAVLAHRNIDAACRKFASLAHQHYRQADAVLGGGVRGSLAPPRLMSAVYHRLLTKMEKAGWDAPQPRVHIGRGPLLLIALRQGLSW